MTDTASKHPYQQTSAHSTKKNASPHDEAKRPCQLGLSRRRYPSSKAFRCTTASCARSGGDATTITTVPTRTEPTTDIVGDDGVRLDGLTFEVHRDPGCGGCTSWVEYLQRHGATVELNEDADRALGGGGGRRGTVEHQVRQPRRNAPICARKDFLGSDGPIAGSGCGQFRSPGRSTPRNAGSSSRQDATYQPVWSEH